MLKIATWNVNSLKVRLPQVLDWLALHSPDLLALQETKVPDDLYPLEAITAAGYECVFNGQRTYNGVALLSRKKMTDVAKDISTFEDPQRRVLGATLGDVRILDLYVPNGESLISEKYTYKLNWLSHLNQLIEAERKKYPHVVLLGDFNIAPHDIDVHDPKQWESHVLCSEKERAAFQEILGLGFVDCFRHLHPAEPGFTWWDYRLNAFKRRMGLRIDHILASQSLAASCTACYVDPLPRASERPSDHAPVIAEFRL